MNGVVITIILYYIVACWMFLLHDGCRCWFVRRSTAAAAAAALLRRRNVVAQMLYHRLQQPSSRIRVIDTGEMAIEKVVAVLKVALTEGSKTASAQFNIPRTTVSTWITRNNLEELVGAAQQTNTVTNVATTSSSPTSLATAVMAPPSSRVRELRSDVAAVKQGAQTNPSRHLILLGVVLLNCAVPPLQPP